jgi:hypothetical protein
LVVAGAGADLESGLNLSIGAEMLRSTDLTQDIRKRTSRVKDTQGPFIELGGIPGCNALAGPIRQGTKPVLKHTRKELHPSFLLALLLPLCSPHRKIAMHL